ncbi:MAG TPA: hypothetical protein VGF94_07730 [Kofleriaceae bacterium]|jgi:hypothetical protein
MTEATVVVGTAGLPAGIAPDKYFGALDYLELPDLFAHAMKPSLVARWAEQAKPGTLGLVAPFPLTDRQAPRRAKLWPHDATTGEFRDSKLGRDAYGSLLATATALHARCLVFRAPDSFSASAANRERLQRFFAEVAPPGPFERVWVPGGLWDLRTAAKLATELGVTCAIDPLARETGAPIETTFELDAPALYLRVERAGALGAARLDDLVDVIDHYRDRRLAVTLATANRWHDARALRKLMDERAD